MCTTGGNAGEIFRLLQAARRQRDNGQYTQWYEERTEERDAQLPELPASARQLARVDVPDVVAFALCLLAVVVKAGNVGLVPKVKLDLLGGHEVFVDAICLHLLKPTQKSDPVSSGQGGVAGNEGTEAYPFGEGVGEGLDAELERPEVPALVEPGHLLGHECLVQLLALRVRDVDCEQKSQGRRVSGTFPLAG